MGTRVMQGRAAPLLERDAELSEIASAIAAAPAGQGRVVLVEGAAGSGKSALVAAARTLAAEHGLRVQRATAGEHEREYAFGCVRQLFEPLLRGAAAPARATLLAGAAAPAEWVIAPAVEDASAAAAHAAAGFAALNAIYWLTSNLAATGPLLLAVDDVHWADDASIAALGHLGRRLGDLPIVLVLALRPEEPGAPAALLDGLRAIPGVAHVAPRPLSERAVAAIVRASAPEATDATCAACHAASAGNPLYLHELLRSLGAGADERLVAEASIPTLAARVGRRVAKVAEGAPALAVAMAVLGDGETLARAAPLAGLDGAAAARIARSLRDIEILSEEDPFAFVHPLVRRSVYDGLSMAERDAAHAAAARLLADDGAPAEAVAAHLGALRPAGSAAVVAGLRAAAGAAAARAAPEAAIRLLSRAVEEGAADPPRAALLLELGRAEVVVRDPACIAHLSEAAGLATDPAVRAAATSGLADVLTAAGQWDAARTMIWEALRELGDGDEELVCDLEALRAAIILNDPSVAHEFAGERARFEALARGTTWSAQALTTLLAAQVALRGEDPAEATALTERALAGGLLDRGAGAWASAQAIMALVYTERYDRALTFAGDLEREGRRCGSLIGVVGGIGARGLVATQRGDLLTAEAELRTVLELIGQSGMSMWSISMFFMYADALLERPSLEDVVAEAEALAVEPSFLATASGAMLRYTRARLRLARGERAGVLEELRAAAETMRALSMGPNYAAWRSTLALALPAGARDEAVALVDEELALARATGLPRALGVALRGWALVVGGEDGVRALRESVDVLAGSEARLEQARSLLALGSALRRGRERVQAREPLTAAMELAHRCGADRLVEHARDELRAAGGRPRRIARTGTDALTASELRVARLAVAGRTNVEIAQELFVSVKTIETHLSHAYAKLGLSGQGARGRLTAALA